MERTETFSVVVGTAGHIDHGKSSLVKRLTGQDPDRLKEEKERGLTIDLGYAELDLGDGIQVGIIDVPGHERFIRNMVAGATGMDFVMLVVAADDGVMPQTREHLDIMSMLGIERGVVVLNKVDLVEADFLELVEDDLREYLQGTFLEKAPILGVSAETGQGFDELRQHLADELPKLERENEGGVFRMPVQRAFSVKGFGTVVTGVPVSGIIRVGDTVEVLPGGNVARVRGIQAYHLQTNVARMGHRTALNLADIDYKDIGRGNVVATQGFFTETRWAEVEVHYLSTNRRPLLHRTQVRFHTGTHDVLGTLLLLDAKVMSPGDTNLAQVRLDETVVIGPGDRFVLRCPSPSVTIGGGVVIGESDHRLKRFRDRVQDGLRKKLLSIDDSSLYLESLLEEAAPATIEVKILATRCKLPIEETRKILLRMVADGKAISFDRDARFVHERGLQKIGELIEVKLASLHTMFPLKMGHLQKDVLRDLRVPPALCKVALSRLENEGRVEVAATGEIVLTGHEVALSDAQRELAAQIESALIDAGFATPLAGQLRESLGIQGRILDQMVDLLVQQGIVIRLKTGLLFHRSKIDEAREIVRRAIGEKGELLAAEFKDLIHSSRKYAIPLLEYLDDIGVTQRRENVRVLTEQELSVWNEETS